MALTVKQQKLLETGFGRVTARVLRMFLKYENLAVGSAAKEDLVTRIYEYIGDRHLSHSTVSSMLRAVQENKNKSVFFYRTDSTQAGAINTSFPRQVANLDSAEIRKGTRPGEISYSYFDDNIVRISFAELQRDYQRDIEHLELIPIDITKVVLLEVDLASGWATLSYDPPTSDHAHGSTAGYYSHYRDWSEQLLGATLVPADLAAAMEELQQSPAVRPIHVVVDTEDGSVQLTGENIDCRNMTVAPGVEAHVQSREWGHYAWLTPMEISALHGVFGPTTIHSPLLRSIRTDIHADPGMIRFPGDCLPQEVNYVLETIRSLS
jgi:hypothetical protein